MSADERHMTDEELWREMVNTIYFFAHQPGYICKPSPASNGCNRCKALALKIELEKRYAAKKAAG